MTCRNYSNPFNKFHSSHLKAIVLKRWNIQAHSASWRDISSHKDSELMCFLADGASLLRRDGLPSPSRKVDFVFHPCILHSTTTVHKCNSSFSRSNKISLNNVALVHRLCNLTQHDPHFDVLWHIIRTDL